MPDPSPFATIPGVELVSAGSWDASKGDGNITRDELAAMVRAAKDPTVDAVPVKIGHKDKRFTTEDGDPAMGWVSNLRLSDDGNTLLGDLVGVPSKLASIIPAAFRKRSIEMFRGFRSKAGKTHSAVLSGLALLGVTAPAVKGLADVMALYSATDDPDVAVVELSDTPTIQPPVSESPDGAADTQSINTGGAPVAKISQKFREALGLKDDATDEDITAALETYEPPAVSPIGSTESGNQPDPNFPQPDKKPEQVAAAAKLPDSMVAVDKVTLSETTTRLAAAEAQLAEIKAGEDKKRRDDIVSLAARQGKIAPTMVAHYRGLLDEDGAETKVAALLAAMPVTLPPGKSVTRRPEPTCRPTSSAPKKRRRSRSSPSSPETGAEPMTQTRKQHIAGFYFRPGDNVTATAGAAVNGQCFVKVSTGGVGNKPKVINATAGDKTCGVAGYDVASGGDVPVLHQGCVDVIAGASLTAGTEVQSDASGHAIAITSGKSAGICTADTASGQPAPIWLHF